MKIIIEGPNNVGKSTLIKKLLERETFKNYEVEHLSNKTPNTSEFHRDLLNMPQDMIFDRFFIGETVYPHIYDRDPKLTIDDILSMCVDFIGNYIIIILDADFEFIIQSNKNKSEEFNYEEVLKEKIGFYTTRKILEEHKLPVFFYKNHKDGEKDYEEFISKIENIVKDMERM